MIAIFVTVPIILYGEFRDAYAERQEILLAAIRDKGLVLGRALEPVLARADELPFVELAHELERYARQDVRLRLLFSPQGDEAATHGFFYVAAAPVVPNEGLEREREELAELGVLERLETSCKGEVPLAVPIELREGRPEILTSITPVTTKKGCWALIVSHPASALAGAAPGRPYWQSREALFAGAIYAALAFLVMAVFLGLWRSLHRFGRLAQRVHREGAAGTSFAERNTIPELHDVAASLDSMVAALRDAANDLRRAAEDNAHAFKTPLGVIRQALEPVRHRLPADDGRAQRAVQTIEASVGRLEGLVASARRLTEATADRLNAEHRPVDLSRLVEGLLKTYGEAAAAKGLSIVGRIEPGATVAGSADLIETSIENVLENALGFSPAAATVEVTLERDGAMVDLTVADRGPGVPPERLERIFERYYSERPNSTGVADEGAEGHYGIGLWVVRRNLQALGGSASATNRAEGGLAVTLRFPVIP